MNINDLREIHKTALTHGYNSGVKKIEDASVFFPEYNDYLYDLYDGNYKEMFNHYTCMVESYFYEYGCLIFEKREDF